VSLKQLGLYLDAVRHMRPRQVVWRARRLVPARLLALGIDAGADVSWRPLPRGLGVNPAPQSADGEPPHRTGLFRAVGLSRAFPRPGFWDEPGDGLLFLFHLHGFEDLAAYAATEDDSGDDFWAEVVESWLAEHSVPRMPGWHPFPVSLRLISWCAAVSGIAGWSSTFKNRLAREVRRQAVYLRRSVEHDIGGNHVLKNGVALAISGTLLADDSLKTAGLRLLRREIGRQFLADGGHEERSTSYHSMLVRDLEDLRRALGVTGVSPRWLDDAIDAGTRWTECMAGPDGKLPLLNDAWEGPAVLGRRHEEPLTQLAESGYVVLRHGDDQAVFDVGPLCPPHLPPHGHADALSFVLWGDGRRLVVDPGAGAYTGPARNRFRGTRAHNTVEVEGESQCVLWGDFRLAGLPTVRAAPPRHHAGGVVRIAAAHDGYRRLEDPVIHQRQFVWWPGAGVVVVDRLQASVAHRVRAPLHLAPGLEPGEGSRVGTFVARPLGGTDVETVDDEYSPRLGDTLPAKTLELTMTVNPQALFGWSVLREGNDVVGLTPTELVLRGEGDAELTVCLAWI
jgi:hypothetical protein